MFENVQEDQIEETKSDDIEQLASNLHKALVDVMSKFVQASTQGMAHFFQK
jgi:hypothetical protein